MARRIDTGSQLAAHTAIQVMLERARQLAEANKMQVGLVYDLAEDQLSLVDLTSGIPDGTRVFKIVSPKSAEMPVLADAESGACGEDARPTLKCDGDGHLTAR